MARLRNPFRRGGKRPPPPPDGRMTLVEHLAELRSRLIKSALAVAVGTIVVFALYPAIQEFLAVPFENLCRNKQEVFGTCVLQSTDPLAPFGVRVRVSTYGGIILALPVLLWQLWRFITPGLHRHEKRYAVPFVLSSLVLFGIGASLAYLTYEKALEFLVTWGGDVAPNFNIDRYISLLLVLMVIFGISFEFPVVLTALQLVGVLKPSHLLGAQRYAVVGIFVFGAVITPSGDPWSLLGICLPMTLFYYLSILIGFLVVRRREKRAVLSAAPG